MTTQSNKKTSGNNEKEHLSTAMRSTAATQKNIQGTSIPAKELEARNGSDLLDFVVLKEALERRVEGNEVSALLTVNPQLVNQADDDRNLPLHLACKHGCCCDVVELLIYQDPVTLVIQNYDGDLPLHLACKTGSWHLLRTVLQRLPSSLRVANKQGRLPLHVACAHGLVPDDALQILLSGHPAAAKSADADGNFPLHLACLTLLPQLRTVQILMQQDSSAVTVRNKAGQLPLHCACINNAGYHRCNEDTVIELLLRAYPRALRVQDPAGNTSLHLACKSNPPFAQQGILSWIQQDLERDLPCDIGISSLNKDHDSKNNTSTVDRHRARDCWLQKSTRRMNNTKTVATAAAADRITLVLMRNYRRACGLKNKAGQVPLHVACSGGRASLRVVQQLVHYDFKAMLLPDNNGNLPLHLVCMIPSQDVTEYLLKKYPPATGVKNNNSMLPLHIACCSGILNNAEVVTKLIDANSSALKVPDCDGNLPLHHCCKAGVPKIVMHVLYRNQSAARVRNARGELPLHLALSSSLAGGQNPLPLFVIESLAEENKRGVRCRDKDGRLPLHRACLRQPTMDRAAIEYLVQQFPVGLQVKDCNGHLPLHLLCMQQQCADVELYHMFMEKYPKVLREKDKQGRLPLHLASKYQTDMSFYVVKLLVDAYPEATDETDNAGEYPLREASEKDDAVHDVMTLVRASSSATSSV